MPRRARKPIERAQVLSAALALADRQGIEGVTLRALAAELDVPPMSLYAHFANKERLLDLMLEEVVRRVFASAGQETWQAELEHGCRQARALLGEHPNWLPLFTRVSVPPLTLALYDRLVELMVRDGHSLDSVMLAVSTAMSFTLGFLLVERMMGAGVPLAQLRLVTELLPRIAGGEYPWLRKAASSFERFSLDAVFDAGLRSLLAGLKPESPRPVTH